MYGVVARDLLQQSEATTGGAVPAFIGISPQTGQGELLDTSSPGVDIPDDLIGELSDLGTTVAFTEFSQAIGDITEGAQVRDNGVYLTFGAFTTDPASGGYQVYASFYHASDDAAGYSYTLVQQQDSWQIKNRTEVWRQ